MVNVNKNQLPNKEASLLLQRFDETVSKLDRTTTSIFLDALLGKEERLTLAKRLATIVLLHEGYTEHKTACLLKLSPTTTGIVAHKIRNGEYDEIIRALKTKKRDYLKLLSKIDSILHLGGLLPHRVGLDRYPNQ